MGSRKNELGKCITEIPDTGTRVSANAENLFLAIGKYCCVLDLNSIIPELSLILLKYKCSMCCPKLEHFSIWDLKVYFFLNC